jgi:drug/metabolite transporter (DMT)-like permease
VQTRLHPPARPPAFAAQVRPYLLYVLQFVVGIYTNMKALQHSNIDTVIVFRASCPLVVCVLEWAFLGRQLPNCRSCMALLCIVLGTCGYVSADKSFGAGGFRAYSWVIAYTLVTATQMAYGKYIVGPGMKFASMWGPHPLLTLTPTPTPNPNPNPNPNPSP